MPPTGGASGSRAFLSRSALPSEWDRRQYNRSELVRDYLKVEGLTVKYIGPGDSDEQAASIIADKPVPQDVPLYYFEVTIVSKGDKGYIGVGYCTESVNPGRLPGWEAHSYGYHGDDGHAFHGSGQGRQFGPKYTTGDVVGALLDRHKKTISYYVNGQHVGVAFRDVQEQHLYPCVGMRTKHEQVCANFGGAPFCADFKKLYAEFRQQVFAEIEAVQLPATIDVPAHMPSSSPAGRPATAADSSSSKQLEAAAAACRQAISALDVSGSAALAHVEATTQAYLEALEAAAADGGSSSPAAGGAQGAAAGSTAGTAAGELGSSRPGQPTKATQPLMLYYVFNYLLHRRCWKTAAIVAQEMVANSTSSSSSHASNSAAPEAAAAAATAEGPVPMEVSASGAPQDQPMPDAPAAAATADAGAGAAGRDNDTVARLEAFTEADVQDALRRQKIHDAVSEGRIADALGLVKVQYGLAVLEQHPRLYFKLRVQQFVELVRQACSSQQPVVAASAAASSGAAAAAANDGGGGGGGASSSAGSGFEAALAYGRAELGPGSKTAADEELLSDALSLLAYADPSTSPCGYLLRERYRAELAEELNGALLKARCGSGQPLLETAYRQAVVLVDELKRAYLPVALELDVPGLCCTGKR